MARSSSSDSSASAPASKQPSYSSTTITEGVTPRPVPRRRNKKQPSNNNTSTKKAGQRSSNGVPNHCDDDYSFLAVDDNDISMTSSDKNQRNVQRRGESNISADSSRGKENETNNHHRSTNGRSVPRDKVKTVQGDDVDHKATKKQQQELRKVAEELSDALAKVSLTGTDGVNKETNDWARLSLSESEYTMGACPPVGYGTSDQISVSTNNQSLPILTTTLRNAIQTFCSDISDFSSTSSYKALISKNSSLLEAIASSSHGLKSVQSLVIEENTTMLVDMAKKCLKALSALTDSAKSSTATATTKKTTNKKQSGINDLEELALLRVTVHILRSIMPTLNNKYHDAQSNFIYEIVIKLFYHCVVIAGDACHKKFQSSKFGGSNYNSTTTKKRSDYDSDDDVVVVFEYALLCLGSYEGLGRLLRANNCSNKTKSKKELMIQWDEMLPIPKIEEEVESKSATAAPAPLPHKQLVKIALESSQCAVSSLLYLSLASIHINAATKRNSNEHHILMEVPNEFHFAPSVIHETCSGKVEGPPMFQKIVTSITLPYVLHSLLDVRSEGVGKKTMFDASLRQVKKVFRILWDGSRNIEEIGNTSNASTLKICSLNLSCEAILFILNVLYRCFELCPDPSNLSDSDQSEINALFDRASTSAMKSVAVFDKSLGKDASGKSDEALLQFHNIVGMKLDLTRKCVTLSSSYIEYCIYRSVHLFRITGSYVLSSFSLHREGTRLSNADDECLMTMWTFFVVDISLQARYGLVTNDATPEMAWKDIELIISTFEEMIANASASIQSRSRSLMLLPELHKEATKMLSLTSDQVHGEKATFLAVMGSILGRCLAPVELELAKSQKDASRNLSYRLSSSDIHAKSALFFSIASEVSTNVARERYSTDSDSQLRKSFDILMKILCSFEDDEIERNTQCISAVEMFAKIATFIGKRRMSIQAQLFAVELLSKISTKAASVGMFDKYQISNRYMMLSSTLEISGYTKESIATMAAALWTVIEVMKISRDQDVCDKAAVVGDSISEHILLFPATYASFFESNETGVSSILSKLTRSYLNYRLSSTDAMTRSNALSKCLEKTLIGKLLDMASSTSKEGMIEMKSELNFSKLLHYAIWNQKRYEVLSSSQLAEIVREVLFFVTKTLKRSSMENVAIDATYLHLIEEAKTFLQAQKKRFGDVTDRDIYQVISSSFHTYFAAILMESKFVEFPRPSFWLQCKGLNCSDHMILKQSYNQLQHADDLFSEDSTQEDSITDACFFAQWAAIQFHQAVIMEHLSLAKISCEVLSNGTRSFVRYNHSALEKYRASLSTCGRAIESFDGEVFPEVVQSLLLILEKLLYRFSLLGDPMSSSESFSLLQQVCSSLPLLQKIINSISAFVLAFPRLELSVPLLNNNSHFLRNVKAISLDDKDETDLDLIRCATAATSSLLRAVSNKSLEVEPLLELSKYVEKMEKVTMRGTAETDEVIIVIQMQALVARSFFLLSKVCLAMGKPLTALQFLWSCRQECKKQLSTIRSVGKCHNVCLEGTLEQNDDLMSMCYEEMAASFHSLGIRRKAEDYAVLAVLKRRILRSDDCQRVSEVGFQELVDLGFDLDGLDGALHSVRTFLRMKFYSSSPDKMTHESLDFKSSLLPKMEIFEAAHIHPFVCRSKTLLTYYDSFQNIPTFRSKAQIYINRAFQTYGDLEQSENYCSAVPSAMLSSATHAELKIRKFSRVDDKTSVSFLLNDVVAARYAPERCYVQAQYELGLIALNNARDRGELYTLWQDFFVLNDSAGEVEFPPLKYTIEARKHFQSALCQAEPSSTKLTKEILRCLALTTGPDDTDATSFFIHASIGGSACAAVSDFFSELNESTCSNGLQGNVKALFQMFDDEKIDLMQRIASFRTLLKDFESLLPDSWNISSLAICPTGEILVSTIQKECLEEVHMAMRTSNICIMQGDRNRNAHSDLLMPLDLIIERSQQQLHGMTEEAQTDQYNEESVRKKWWNERHKINDDLRSLLEYAEAEYFGHSLLQESLQSGLSNQCGSSGDDDSSEYSSFGPSRLTPRFEQVEMELDKDGLIKLTVSVLKERLSSLGVASAVFQKMRKKELIALLEYEIERNSEELIVANVEGSSTEMSACVGHQSSRGEPCTILILDEHLQRFPFESMDMFSSKAVTRVPSLSFVFATLVERGASNVDPDKICYVLDPESNLSETASTLGPALNSLASSRGWDWSGVVGEMPSPEFMTEILKRDNGMFLYCGHGGGEKFFSRSQVEEIMTSRDDGVRGCRPPVVLMGCSSAKLQSVNYPKENPSGKADPIYYEPEGIALSYLIAGAPCVVGNLWDVTDRDIDRYCLTLLEDFVKGQEGSLAKCVAEARRACKLRYIVGSAPVCYGLPVKCVRSREN